MSIDLTCPRCMEAQTVRLDLDDGHTLTCAGCEEQYGVDDIRRLVDGWAKLLPWLESYPAAKPEPAAR